MRVERDPYFDGRVVDGKSDPLTDRIGTLMGGWIVVFGLNLIVPLILSSGMSGKAGISLAIVIQLAAGCYVVARYRWLGEALVIGGSLVAVSQFLPFLQFGAGIAGLAASRWIEDVLPQRYQGFGLSDRDGFIATVVTGSLLIGVALAIGLVIRWMSSPRPGKRGVMEFEQI